jgi:hypothetical protein
MTEQDLSRLARGSCTGRKSRTSGPMDVTLVSRAMPSSGAEEITRCGARQSARRNVKVTVRTKGVE